MKRKSFSEPVRRLRPKGSKRGPFYSVPVRGKTGKVREVRRACFAGWYCRSYDPATQEQAWIYLGPDLPSARNFRQTLIGRDVRGEEEIKAVEFKAAFNAWLDLKQLRPPSRKDLDCSLEGIYIPAFGGRPVNSITTEDIEKLLKQIRTKRKASARTQEKHLVTLRSFFRWCALRRYALRNPCEGLKAPRREKYRPTALTPEEARKLLEKCKTSIVKPVKYSNRTASKQTWTPPEHLYIATLVSILTGLRRRSVLEMRWGWLDLEARRISIPGEFMKAGRSHEMPLNAQIVEDLRQLLRGKRKVPGAEDLVLGIQVHNLETAFRSALKRAGLPRMRWHDLRATFATWMESLTSYAAVQALLGHSPQSVTLAYVEPSWQTKLEAIDRLPRLLEAPGAFESEPASKTGV